MAKISGSLPLTHSPSDYKLGNLLTRSQNASGATKTSLWTKREKKRPAAFLIVLRDSLS